MIITILVTWSTFDVEFDVEFVAKVEEESVAKEVAKYEEYLLLNIYS